MLAHTSELVRGPVGMDGSGPLADAEKHSDLPRSLASQGPAQHLEFSRRRGNMLGNLLRMSNYRSPCSRLSVERKKRDGRNQSRPFVRVGREGRIAIYTEEEVLSPRQMHPHSDTEPITKRCLCLVLVRGAAPDICRLVPDNRRAFTPAMLHHGIAMAFRRVGEHTEISRRSVVNAFKACLAVRTFRDDESGHGLESETFREADQFMAKLVTRARRQDLGSVIRQHEYFDLLCSIGQFCRPSPPCATRPARCRHRRCRFTARCLVGSTGSDQTALERPERHLMFVDAIQFAGSVVGVDRRCAGTYGEDHANFPRSLSFQRPAQDFEFPRRQRRRRDRNRQRHQNFRCRLTPERGFCRSPKSRRRIPACVQSRDPKLSGRQYESSLHQTPTPMSVYRGGLVDLCRSTSPLPAQMRGRRHPPRGGGGGGCRGRGLGGGCSWTTSRPSARCAIRTGARIKRNCQVLQCAVGHGRGRNGLTFAPGQGRLNPPASESGPAEAPSARLGAC